MPPAPEEREAVHASGDTPHSRGKRARSPFLVVEIPLSLSSLPLTYPQPCPGDDSQGCLTMAGVVSLSGHPSSS